jgi:hypothetical protein
VQTPAERQQRDSLQGVHWTVSLLKRWLLGTHAGAVKPKLGSDFFRMVLGFGAGDLKATTTGDRGTTIEIPNVVLVSRKVHSIERLISVKPERAS